MNTRLSLLIRLLGICAAISLMFGCAEMQNGSSGTSGGSGSYADSGGGVANTNAASGTQGDTLEACLARIPSDSTDSQRMFAELTCQRDEKARHPIKVVPGN